jgi:hypothetical protein
MPFYAIDIPLFLAIDDIPSVDIDVTTCSNIDVMPFYTIGILLLLAIDVTSDVYGKMGLLHFGHVACWGFSVRQLAYHYSLP